MSSTARHSRSFIGDILAVRDLATRFADGRLTNQKLLDANDEELFDLLTAVYGIGKVSLLLFSLAASSETPHPSVDWWAFYFWFQQQCLNHYSGDVRHLFSTTPRYSSRW